MSDYTRRILIGAWLIPTVLAAYLYPEAVHYYWLGKYDFDGTPERLAILKYCVSLVFDWANINMFSFAWPWEFSTYFNAAYPQCNGEIQARYYHNFIKEVDGTGGEPYIYFPWILGTVSAAFGGLAGWIINRKPAEEKAKNQKFLRGVQRVSASDFCKISKAKIKDPIAVLPTTEGNILLSDKMLRQHSLILGSTGTGKSQLLISLINSFIINSKARLVFVDRKGEFYSLFGGAKDTLIHPFDQRGKAWNIFNEIEVELVNGQLVRPPQDTKAIAELLYQPRRQKDNQNWYESAAAVFVSAICHCIIHGTTTNRDLCLFLQSGVENVIRDFGELPPECRGGLSVLGTDPKSKTANSIMSICNTTALQLSHFRDAGDFSVRDWLHHGTGNLYISTAGRNDNTFTGIVTLLVDLIGREVKELQDDGNQPTSLVFVLDELGALPAMDTLKFLLTQARSKGVAVVLANQTFSKIKSVYGDAEARDLLANTKSRYFFALPEAADAKYISELLGSAEVERITQSENSSHSTIFGKMDGREGKNYSRQITQDATFLPGTIESLEVGQAIIQQAALPGIVSMVRFKQMPDQKKINAEYEPIKHELQAATAYAAAQKLEAETAAPPEAKNEAAAPEPHDKSAPDPEPPTEQTAGNEADLFL